MRPSATVRCAARSIGGSKDGPSSSGAGAVRRTGDVSAFGMYASGEYQFARRWFGGARYDWSERAYDASLVDKGPSLVLTYWPSEFSQIRGQYRRTRYAGERDSERGAVPIHLLDRGAWGACVLTVGSRRSSVVNRSRQSQSLVRVVSPSRQSGRQSRVGSRDRGPSRAPSRLSPLATGASEASAGSVVGVGPHDN